MSEVTRVAARVVGMPRWCIASLNDSGKRGVQWEQGWRKTHDCGSANTSARASGLDPPLFHCCYNSQLDHTCTGTRAGMTSAPATCVAKGQEAREIVCMVSTSQCGWMHRNDTTTRQHSLETRSTHTNRGLRHTLLAFFFGATIPMTTPASPTIFFSF